MGYILFALFTIHLTTTLATQQIPLKCFLKGSAFDDDFNKASRISSVVNSKKVFEFDSVTVDSINIDEDGLQFYAKNLEVRGIQDAILDAINFDFESNVIRITMHMDVVKRAQYKTNGSIFLLPIEGEGIWNETLKNLQIYMVCPFDIKEENGEKFIDLKSYTFWYDIRGYAKHKLTNLYYGNKELSDSMHSLINQNWKLLSIKYGGRFCNPFVRLIFEDLKNYLRDVPLRDLSTC